MIKVAVPHTSIYCIRFQIHERIQILLSNICEANSRSWLWSFTKIYVQICAQHFVDNASKLTLCKNEEFILPELIIRYSTKVSSNEGKTFSTQPSQELLPTFDKITYYLAYTIVQQHNFSGLQEYSTICIILTIIELHFLMKKKAIRDCSTKKQTILMVNQTNSLDQWSFTMARTRPNPIHLRTYILPTELLGNF